MNDYFLPDHSPALYSHLKRFFKPEELNLIINIYDYACKNGSLEEGGVQREPGMSFNPRPARIAQILITEGQERSFDAIAAAILSCGDKLETSLNIDSAIIEITEKIRYQLKNGKAQLSDKQVNLICLSHFLDELRHFHMHDLPDIKVNQKISTISESELLKSDQPELKKLQALIHHCLSRLSRLNHDYKQAELD